MKIKTNQLIKSILLSFFCISSAVFALGSVCYGLSKGIGIPVSIPIVSGIVFVLSGSICCSRWFE